MECNKCHAILPDGVKFCTNCGSPIEQQPVVDTTPRCPSCGAEIVPGTKFCTSCGAPLAAATQPAARQAAPANPYIAASAPASHAAGSQPVNAQLTPHAPAAASTPPSAPPSTPPVPPVNVAHEVVTDNDPSKKTNWTVVILSLLVVGLVVALVLILTGGKNKTSYDSYEMNPVEPIYGADSAAVVEEVAAEDTMSILPLSSSCTVYGMWDELSVRINLSYHRTSGSDISAEGYAYYGDSELCYRLSGNGTMEGDRLSLTLYEYDNSDGTYSGYWKGTLVRSSSYQWNYYGYFYNSDGAQHCWFDLYSRS